MIIPDPTGPASPAINDPKDPADPSEDPSSDAGGDGNNPSRPQIPSSGDTGPQEPGAGSNNVQDPSKPDIGSIIASLFGIPDPAPGKTAPGGLNDSPGNDPEALVTIASTYTSDSNVITQSLVGTINAAGSFVPIAPTEVVSVITGADGKVSTIVASISGTSGNDSQIETYFPNSGAIISSWNWKLGLVVISNIIWSSI